MPPRERLVRKAPLMERVKAYLDVHDWLLWISEELNTNDWEDFAKDYAFIIGFIFNLVYIVAQANTASGPRNDDILLDSVNGPGWFTWFSRLAATSLSIIAFFNGVLTFHKKRHYRLFEQPIETAPTTPSAHRVRVDSSPAAATPLRYFQDLLGSVSADSRAHPDAGRDVWEISVWDPNPLCLDMFCLFSPLHVVFYWLNFPVPPMDQQPSIRVVTTIAIGAFLSLSLWFLRSSFANQIRDNGVIQREVLHEYDNKFVHPSQQKLYRDVGIQAISKNRSRDSSVGVRGSSNDLASQITTYTPTTIINRTFRTNPNPVYASQYDPDNLRSATQTPSARPYSTSNANYSTASTATGADFSSPIRPSHTPNPFRQSQPQPQFRPSASSGDGGSLGVFSHANSPLRKSTSTNFVRDREERGREERGRDSLVGLGVERRTGTPARREGSPLKRVSMPGAGLKATGSENASSAAERFARWNGGAGSLKRESGRF